MKQRPIQHFETINQLHTATGFVGRTDLPDIHVFTLEETYPSTQATMSPYSLRFYGLGVYEDVGDALLEVNTERRVHDDTLVFQGPGHVVAWVRGAAQRGYIVLFQPEFLSMLPMPLAERFPFFQPTARNVLPLQGTDKHRLHAALAQLHTTFHSEHPYREPLLQAQLLIVLYECRRVYDAAHARTARESDASALASRFLQLVTQHALTRQTVHAYAELLGVTPNHLSQIVSHTLGRNARDVIAEYVVLEAKKLLRYSDLPIGAIAAQLGFAETTHFSRFFRRLAGTTPLDYRRGGTFQPPEAP